MLPATINIFEKAARKAGKILVRDFGEIENLQIQSKGIGDFVTSTDLKVEQSLLETLRYYYPNASFITEESGFIEGEGETIVIDPIDGTSNFIHGIPHLGIVIGKIVNDEITDGITYNPILNEFYWASKGKGSWCNNKRIRVSKRKDLSKCLIGSNIPSADKFNSDYFKEIANLSKISGGLRSFGATSIDLAYIASGKIDGFWQKDLNLWDFCSGVLLIREAGGRISEPNGNNLDIKSRDILASNNLVHNKLIENLTLL